jgi:hypothetical protein
MEPKAMETTRFTTRRSQKHMHRTRPIQVVIVGAAACAALLASPAAQGAPQGDQEDVAPAAAKPDKTPTFEEFEAATARDPHGQYIVNGDEAIGTKAELRGYYELMVSSADTDHQSIIVNQSGGGDDVWSASEALDLTYCISDEFGADKADIAAVTAAGAGQWEAASSGIDFIYVPSEDGNCTTSNSAVLFSVEPVVTSQYIARAFFPSSPASEQNVLVADSIWSSGWAPENVMAHELGHVLGLRHEHTRPEAGGVCFEDNSWRPVTPYDSASIMHYPQCNGSTDDLSMSPTDVEGIASLYGS